MYQTEGRNKGARGHHGKHGGFGSRCGAPEGFAEYSRARHGFGKSERGHWGRGFGGGRERLFDAGDLKLVILKLLSEQPSYGYQLIKTMEEQLAGGYAPSPGVIYPTLTLLEEEGLAAVATSESNKKVYSLTPEGQQFLETNKARVSQIFERLEAQGDRFQRGRSPEIMKAFMDLRGAVMARVARGTLTPDQVTRIAEAIHGAAKAIDQL